MNETVNDLTVEYEENGQVVVKEIDKVVLSKGAWATLLFRFQMFRPETADYGPDKYVIQRYKKVGGEYKRQSKFNISGAEQARKIAETLNMWLSDEKTGEK